MTKRPMKITASLERKRDIFLRRQAKQSLREIALAHGISKARVGQIFQDAWREIGSKTPEGQYLLGELPPRIELLPINRDYHHAIHYAEDMAILIPVLATLQSNLRKYAMSQEKQARVGAALERVMEEFGEALKREPLDPVQPYYRSLAEDIFK